MTRPDPTKFKKPNTWATYTEQRCSLHFKTHSTLGMCKASIAGLSSRHGSGRMIVRNGKTIYDYPLDTDVYIYQYDPEDDEWIERYHLPAGSYRTDHELWTNPPKATPRQVKAPSQERVDAAIASIMQAVAKE